MPNDKITSSVDYYIKKAYESTFEPGKVIYKDMIEEGMLKRIEEINPIEACKLRIDRYKRLLEEEESKLDDLKDLEKTLKRSKKQNKKMVDPRLEKIRIEKLTPIKDNLTYQVNKGNADWKKVSEALLFDSANEAREWVITKLQEECLIE